MVEFLHHRGKKDRIQLVGKFNSQKQEENKNLETSFYQYQANESLSAVASMILGDSFQNVGGQYTKEKPEVKEENETREEKDEKT